jgi:hypothetical protein
MTRRTVLPIVSNGTYTALFDYDGKNRQIMRSIDGVVRFSVWDDWELLESMIRAM